MMRRLLKYITPILLSSGIVLYGLQPMAVAAAEFSVSPTSATPGSNVSVSGSGFEPFETEIMVTATFDSSPVAGPLTADSQGHWSTSVRIDDTPGGRYYFSAEGSITKNATDKPFDVTPKIQSSSSNVAAGSTITISGKGFKASEGGITIEYDSSTVADDITANSLGSWTKSFTVPASTAGSHTIDAYGSNTSASNVPNLTFTISAGISLSRTSGVANTSVTVTGNSFGANESGITVTYDGTVVASSITADSQGSWTATFQAPASPAGSHTVDAYGGTTDASDVTNVNFSITPAISLSKTSGTAGMPVTVTGSGFASGETGISVTYDGGDIASGLTANNQGGWTTTIRIPPSTSSSHVIDARGSTTSASAISDITFTVSAGITASQTSGAPGTLITVTGSGFSSGETGIVVTYDGITVLQGITADSDGGWVSKPFVVPPSAYGSHSIRARSSYILTGDTIEAAFSVTPGVTLDPGNGNVGQAVTLKATGLSAGNTVKVFYDDKEMLLNGLITDNQGSLTTTITIPRSVAAAHTIRVVDAQSNEAKTTFNIAATQPTAPKPTSPDDGGRIGIIGSVTPTLKWSTVEDPNGVTYDLQIDTSPDFSDPVLSKTDIPQPKYTLVEAEALPQGDYYWRVKAVNGALVESDWSQTRVLKAGWATWTLITVPLLVLAAIAAGIYFLWPRLRPRKRETVIGVPEVVMPSQAVQGQWRTVEPTGTPQIGDERPMPLRLALPQPTKAAKTLSTEDQARLKVVMDFAQSLPLVEPDYTVKWITEMMESNMGIQLSAPVYEQLCKGEIDVRYEPAWMKHPIYNDLVTLLEGQAVLQDLNNFVDSTNRCAAEAVSTLQDIYRDAAPDIPPDFFQRGGWIFISTIYADAMSWYLGRSLREPSERDYSIKPRGGDGEDAGAPSLFGEPQTSFAGEIIQGKDQSEAQKYQALHLKLRRNYRNNAAAKQVASIITQLQVQRSRLLDVFSQFSHLKQ